MRFDSSMVANTRYDPIYTTERREELLVPFLFGHDTAFFHRVYTEAKGNGTKFDPFTPKQKERNFHAKHAQLSGSAAMTSDIFRKHSLACQACQGY